MTYFFFTNSPRIKYLPFPALLGPNATEEKKSCYKLMLDLSVTVGLSFSATLWVKSVDFFFFL